MDYKTRKDRLERKLPPITKFKDIMFTVFVGVLVAIVLAGIYLINN